jgi:type II secretory pathway pseudopilin PulG
MIVIAIIGILAAVAIPNFIAYRNKSFCSRAESDANSISGSIADYFAIPTHTAITDASYNAYAGAFIPPVNSFTVSATAPNTAITITVTDASGRCPADYRAANAIVAPGTDGWNGLVYQKVITN